MTGEMHRDALQDDDGCACTLTGMRREQSRMRLMLSTGEVLFMPCAMLKERRYRVGMPFDRASFDAFIERRAYAYAMERAVSLLAIRARTRQELHNALMRAAYPQETISGVLDYLEQAGYLDDLAVAEQYAASRQAKGFGARRIRLELQRKGIDIQTIEKAIESIDQDAQFSAALRVARKAAKGRDLSDPADRRRLLAALSRRGIDYTLCQQLLNLLMEESGSA